MAAARRALRSFAESGAMGRVSSSAGTALSKRIRVFSTTDLPRAQQPEGSSSAPVPEKGFFAKALEKYSIGRQQGRIELGERLFRAAQRRADDVAWYTAGHVGRDFRPRHAMLTMHVWFLHRRLLADRIDPHASLLVQEEVFDVLWNDSRSHIRAEGVNELTVNKHMKDTQQVSFQHMTHYDHAFTEYKDDPVKRFEELVGAVWNHVLLKDEDAPDDLVKRLAAYVEYQHENIVNELPDRYFSEGRINWGCMPDFKGMKDSSGRSMQPLPLDPDDSLPEPWIKVRTDGGDIYYWDTEANMTSWQRPT